MCRHLYFLCMLLWESFHHVSFLSFARVNLLYLSLFMFLFFHLFCVFFSNNIWFLSCTLYLPLFFVYNGAHHGATNASSRPNLSEYTTPPGHQRAWLSQRDNKAIPISVPSTFPCLRCWEARPHRGMGGWKTSTGPLGRSTTLAMYPLVILLWTTSVQKEINLLTLEWHGGGRFPFMGWMS